MLYVGAPILALGLLFLVRGWVYTIWPNGKMAERRKRRNLKVGFTTDMKLFGRKIRRLGLMVTLVGGGLVGWRLSHLHDDVPTTPPPATPTPTTTTPPPTTPTPPTPPTPSTP